MLFESSVLLLPDQQEICHDDSMHCNEKLSSNLRPTQLYTNPFSEASEPSCNQQQAFRTW